MVASYSKRQIPDGYVFDVEPSPPPAASAIITIQAISVVILTIIAWTIVRGASGSGLIATLVAGAFAGLCYWLFKRQIDKVALRQRYPSSIVVSQTGIEVNGAAVKREDIHRFVLRNWALNAQAPFSATVVAGTPGIELAFRTINASIHSGAARARSAYERKVASVSWQLDLEAGGRATMLACGLDDTTARGLMEDISRALHI